MIALDIGGTKLAAALIDGDRIVAKRTAETPAESPDLLSKELFRICRDWLSDSGEIGVACTGIYRDGCVHAVNQDMIFAWHGYPLLARLRQLFGANRRYVILNDAVAACWGEYRRLQPAPSEAAYLTVSTGIGGGLIVGGKLLLSPSGIAGHVGHTTVRSTLNPRCSCGRHGCVEAIASGAAIAGFASQRLARTTTAQEVFALAADDAMLDAIIEQSAAAVAQLIANLKMTLDTEVVVVGGGVGLANGYIDRLRTCQMALPADLRVPLKAASLGADSGLLGVALWAEENPQPTA